jgi:transcriptional regulator with XRE-family HTH domain
MTTQTKKATAVLAGSVVLASAAYGLGSQAGDGGAIARESAASATPAASTTDRDRGPRGGFGLERLAERLGVSTTALRDALSEIRRSAPSRDERRARLVAALAAALNLSADRVSAALEQAFPDRDAHRDAFAAELARELGVDAAKLRAALDKLKDERRDGRRGDRRDRLADALATELGVDADRVRDALRAVLGDRRDRHRGDRRDRRDDRRQALATALGVSEERLETALRAVRSDELDAFATQLAQKLSISADKVKDVLDDLPRRGRRHG